mgnify:CR=1 FL=1
MKTNRLIISLLATIAFLSISSPAWAHKAHQEEAASESKQEAELIKVSDETDAAWLAHARADYPLNSCMVSGDEFDGGPMGQPIDFIYRQPGKDDRLIRMCCKDCIRDFRKDPEKYLKEIDAAKAASAHPHAH